MTEQDPFHQKEPKPTDLDIKLFGGTMFDAENDQIGYYTLRTQAINKGERVFMVRTFDSDTGLVIDYYNGKKLIAYIDLDFDGSADVYVGDECITDKPLPICDAVTLVESLELAL